jgi:hypothetical protein
VFLSDLFHSFENRLVPNNVIMLRNVDRGVEVKEASKDIQVKRAAQSNSSSSVPWPLGPACIKMDTQDT